MTVRPARIEERVAVRDALAEAFMRERFSVWRYPDPAERRAGLISGFAEMLEAGTYAAEVVEDLSGVALWRTVDGQTTIRSFDGLEPRVADALVRVYGRAPTQAHHYLGFLAAPTPGTGAGTRLLEHALGRIDAAHEPAALWTATPENVGFYARFGFEVRETVELEFGAATWMWRPPRR